MDELALIGKKISEIRVKRGLTQENLAEMVHYSANHIAKLESARTNPSFNLLVNIARALKIEIKDLFDYEDFNTTEYMKKELLNTIKNSNDETIKLLYKFYKTLNV